MNTTFTAPDIECGGCATSIEKAIGRMPGVDAVLVDVETRTISVAYDIDRINATRLAETLEEIGFPVQPE